MALYLIYYILYILCTYYLKAFEALFVLRFQCYCSEIITTHCFKWVQIMVITALIECLSKQSYTEGHLSHDLI